MITRLMLKACLILLALLLVISPTQASFQTGYQLGSSVMASGGGTLLKGSYSLTGTIGQMEAAHVYHAATYQLGGGFWYPSELQTKVYLPLIKR